MGVSTTMFLRLHILIYRLSTVYVPYIYRISTVVDSGANGEKCLLFSGRAKALLFRV